MCARKLLQQGDNGKNSSVFKLFGSPRLGQATGAGPWLLSGVKAEPVQVAEPPWKGLLGTGNSWTSPRHLWKGQQMEAASGQILTCPFLAAVLQSTGCQAGLPFPVPHACGGHGCEEQPPLSHPPSAAQPCPCPGRPAVGYGPLCHTGVPFPFQTGQMSQPSIKMMGTQAIISQSLWSVRDFLVIPPREKWVSSYVQMSPEPLWAVSHLSLGLCPKQGHSALFMASSQTRKAAQENKDSLLLSWVLKGVLPISETSTAQLHPFHYSPLHLICCTWWRHSCCPGGSSKAEPCSHFLLPVQQGPCITLKPATEHFPES